MSRQPASIAPALLAPTPRSLARARRELAVAQESGDPAERYRHAHLAALRTAAAVVEGRAVPVRGARPRSVWEILARQDPSLAAWAAFFAAGADRRAAIESGRISTVPAEVADHLLGMARMFLDEVETGPVAAAS